MAIEDKWLAGSNQPHAANGFPYRIPDRYAEVRRPETKFRTPITTIFQERQCSDHTVAFTARYSNSPPSPNRRKLAEMQQSMAEGILSER